MANTAEGITVGEQKGLDPNDPGDFAAIMEGRGVQREEGEEVSPDRSIASGLTTAEPGQPTQTRDPDTGKFVSNQEATTAQAEEEAATETSGEETGELPDDPEIQAFLAKYDGDVTKALKGAANAQTLIGRRDEEREALKTELAELRGMVQGLAARGATASIASITDAQVTEIATSQIAERGYAQAATDAANHAQTSGDERAYRTILEQWLIEDPLAATDFNTDFRLWQRDQRAAAESQTAQPPAWQVRAEEQAKIDSYGETFLALKSEIGDEAFAVVAEKLDAALDQMPDNVLQMIDSTDSEARTAAFRIVADRAMLLAAREGKALAAPAVAEPAASASVQRKLSGARVASGALRPPEKPAAATNREDAIKEFKRQIVEAPTTNISSGLTYGPTP